MNRSTTKPLTRAEIAALAADLRTMRDQIEAGHLAGSTALKHRIEGAVAVLNVVLGRAASLELDGASGQPNPEASQ